ncbi:MAG: hypothetical protein AAFO62_09660, partial [Pseudomonadota bacterium]
TGGVDIGIGLAANLAGGRYIADLPESRDIDMIAAAPAEGGHWRLVNRQGEKITVSTPEEMTRAIRVLAPAALATEGSLGIVLTSNAVFTAGRFLDKLPATAKLRVIVDKNSVPLVPGKTASGATALFAEVRPNVRLQMTSPAAFREATHFIGRKLNRDRIRILAVTDANTLNVKSVVKRRDGADGVAVDQVSASRIAESMDRLRGQTAVMTGRVDGANLIYRTPGGREKSLDLAAVRKAAADNDVALIVLNSATPRQPGARNWLWQRTTIDGLEAALAKDTFGDFVSALASTDSKLAVAVAETPSGRVHLTAQPMSGDQVATGDGFWSTFGSEVLSETAGQVLTTGIEIYGPDRERAKELGARIIPGIPSLIQFGYLGLVVLGLYGWGFARSWWFRLWPQEERGAYGFAIGYHLARFVRLVLYLTIFTPLVGLPAAVCTGAVSVFNIVMMPFNVLAWIGRKVMGRPA